MKTAIISGSGLYDPSMLTDVGEIQVSTRFGDVRLLVGKRDGEEIGFLPRHGRDHSVPPHLINYRANLLALKKLGIERILATAAVGSLNLHMAPGDCVVVDQFLDFTKTRPVTYYTGGEFGVVHVDYTEPYCREIRGAILRAGKEDGLTVHDGGCYVCTEGPRFETPAEIRMFEKIGGDLVGMTTVPEVIFARELGICYATVAMVTNFAAGISPQPLTHQEVLTIMGQNTEKLRQLLIRALGEIPVDVNCQCIRGMNDLSALL
jgi:5'-methylthioadenosine phosphorylase